MTSPHVDTLQDRFSRAGVVMVEHLLSPRDLAALERAFDGNAGRRHHSFTHEFIGDIRANVALGRLAARLAGPGARLVRIIAFDKSTATNWFVPWHQDRTIAVLRRVDTEGYANWTVKDGHIHVEPPVRLLQAMLTLRVHLDDCGEDAGPLEVIPASHSLGRLDQSDIAARTVDGRGLVCLAARGDILTMRPLLLHRSQRARLPTRRRVLHLEYCADALPNGLSWSLASSATSEVLN